VEERCPQRQKSSVERLKAKVEPLLPEVTVDFTQLGTWWPCWVRSVQNGGPCGQREKSVRGVSIAESVGSAFRG
jgi:hypothetical protein